MQLHCKKLGQGKPLFILHGLLGMLDNWQSIGKVLSEKFEVYLLDARNHGHSPHSDIFSYDVMAEDLCECIMEQKAPANGNDFVPAYIIGHSMGGKTAMKFAQKFPEKVEKLVVVDIAPRQYSAQHDAVFKALCAVDFNLVQSRSEAEKVLEKYISENDVRQFLLKNLYRKEPNKLAWRFNLGAIAGNLKNIGEAAVDKPFNKPALFLRGEKSNYIQEEDRSLIKALFPLSETETIRNAGHWIHAEQPELFVRAVVEFLEK